MALKSARFVILLGLLASAAAHAEGMYALDGAQGLDNETRQSVTRYFAEVERALPPPMVSRLRTLGRLPVHVGFGALDGSSSIPVPSCKPDEMGAQSRPVVLGRTDAGSMAISLNSGWLEVVRRGKAASPTFACGHRDLYTYALAVLAHETSHVYDFSHYRVPAEQTKFERCRALTQASSKSGHANAVPSACQPLLRRGYSVSDDPNFRALQDWKRGFFRIHEKNVMFSRITDPYMYTNPKEDFAVNFEFFTLDPEFACRFPALADYYRAHFGWAPARSCTVNTQVPLSTTQQTMTDLNPDRIYAVHYLFAGKDAGEMMSAWGHAMVRLIVCAPAHKDQYTGALVPATPFGPECMKDIDYHVVGSYRANVADIVTNSWSGIVGKYPSQLFLLPMVSVIDEYTRGQVRDLTSYPLNLTASEKRFFVYRMLEQYWSFRGHYRFIGENCANETADLIGSVPAVSNQFSGDGLLSPLGLRERLLKTGLADGTPLANPADAAAEGYYFPPASSALEQALAILAPDSAGTDFKTAFRAYLSRHSADERLADEKAATALASSPHPAERLKAEFKAQATSAAALLIESQVNRTQEDSLLEQAMKVMDAAQAGKDDFSQKLQALSQLEAREQPSSGVASGYGIPLAEDLPAVAQSVSPLSQQIDGLLAELRPMILDRVGSLKHESEQTVTNINAFRTGFLDLIPVIAADEAAWLRDNVTQILGGENPDALRAFLDHAGPLPACVANYRKAISSAVAAKAGSVDHINDRKVVEMILAAAKN